MRPIAMCPITVRVARLLRIVPGQMFKTEQGVCRQLTLYDNEFASMAGISTKRVREALLKLERLGALHAEDLLPGPSRTPKGRTIIINEYSAAWSWLNAYDELELAFRQLPEVE